MHAIVSCLKRFPCFRDHPHHASGPIDTMPPLCECTLICISKLPSGLAGGYHLYPGLNINVLVTDLLAALVAGRFFE